MQLVITLLFIAEVSYIFVGIDLLRRAKRTRGLPEFFLGMAFVFNGLSYLFADLPFIIDIDQVFDEFSYTGRIFGACSALTVAGFTWRVFEREAGWAKSAVWATGGLLLLGLAISAFEGDWEGASPLTYKGYWFVWFGGFLAFSWFAVESLRAYSRSRLQLRIGLGDPIVSNRFLLIGLYGVLAASTYPIFLWMTIMYELHGSWPEALEVFVGIIEVISLVALWTSFAAPSFYQRWVGKGQESA